MIHLIKVIYIYMCVLMDDLCLFVSATVLLAVGFARYDKDKDHQYKFTYTGMLVGL